MTLNSRPPEAVRRVYEILADLSIAVLTVLDRPEPGTREAYVTYGIGESAEISGKRGWICPAHAWNVGFSKIETEYVVCISSEVLLAKDAIDRIREVIAGPPVVVFGKCVDDGDARLITGPNPNLLCSAEQKRPLGFIVAMPMWAVRTVGGYDEAFMDGLWYEDDDFMARLFALGLPFLFDDAVNGVHQHHERPVLESLEGRARIAKSRNRIITKHGSEHPWNEIRKTGWSMPGMAATVMEKNPYLLEQ
jgi:hypothetical protein